MQTMQSFFLFPMNVCPWNSISLIVSITLSSTPDLSFKSQARLFTELSVVKLSIIVDDW